MHIDRPVLFSVALIAGTCIGAGILALPLSLGPLGLTQTIIYMVIIWSFTYLSALVNIDLTLQSEKTMSLSGLARLFGGEKAKRIGGYSFILFLYTLLIAYVHAGSAVFMDINESMGGAFLAFDAWRGIFLCGGILLFSVRSSWLQAISQVCVFLLIIVMLISAGVFVCHAGTMSFDLPHRFSFQNIALATPILFTSFGFQVLFHTVSRYCDRDAVRIRRAFFWGSMVPMIMYLIWTLSILWVLANSAPELYSRLLGGGLTPSELVSSLSIIMQWDLLRSVFLGIIALAIITSFLGVGVGLWGALSDIGIGSSMSKRLWIALPVFACSGQYGSVFLKALGYSGVLLAFIAIGFPLWLLAKARSCTLYTICLQNKKYLFLLGFGGWIIFCQVFSVCG